MLSHNETNGILTRKHALFFQETISLLKEFYFFANNL